MEELVRLGSECRRRHIVPPKFCGELLSLATVRTRPPNLNACVPCVIDTMSVSSVWLEPAERLPDLGTAAFERATYGEAGSELWAV